MKSSMMKLAVFVMITAIAMFTVVAMATAGEYLKPPTILEGQYASTGGGTCLEALTGFGIQTPLITSGFPTLYDGRYVPSIWGAGGPWVIMTYNSAAVWTFEQNGTGKVARTSSYIFFSPLGCPTCPWPSGATSHETWNFTYHVGADGKITLTENGSYVSTWDSGLLEGTPYSPFTGQGFNRRGTVAMDGMTIVLNGGLPDIITVPGAPSQLICNDSAVLVRIKD